MHRLVETGRWRHLFLAANLLAMQAFGNAPAALTGTTLVVCLYVVSWMLVDGEARARVATLRAGWPVLAAVTGGVASLLLVLVTLVSGTDGIVKYGLGRRPDGTVPIDVFLMYGGNIVPSKWLELLLRVSPAVDYNLYVGLATVPLAAIGLALDHRRRHAHLLVAGVLTFFLAAVTPLTVIAYYVWPLLAYFRHVGAFSCVAKLYLCLLAGVGVDALLRREPPRDGRARMTLTAAALAMAGVGFALARLAAAGHVASRVKSIVDGGGAYGAVLGDPAVHAAVSTAAWLAWILAVLFASATHAALRRPLAVVAVALTVLDVFSYKDAQLRLSAFPLSDAAYAQLAFAPMPWTSRRCTGMPCGSAPRFEALRPWPGLSGERYWTTSAFVYEDEAGSSMRIDYWMEPLDALMRSFWRQPLGDPRVRPAGLVYWKRLEFPGHPAALKVAGVTEDKVQFFSQACVIDDIATAGSRLLTARDAGDWLVLTPDDRDRRALPSTVPSGEEDGEWGSARLHLPYHVDRFDANTLDVTVQAGAHAGAWLVYADLWHPAWRATVNGRQVPVVRANVAYKAVALDPGVNHVHFHFALRLLTWLQSLFAVNALAWIAGLAWSLGAMWRRPPLERSPSPRAS